MIIKHLGRRFALSNVFVILKRYRSSSEIALTHYDIVVAGGGMVGTTLACSLGKNPKFSDKRILLLESGKDSGRQLPENYSNRVSTLNTAAYKLLNDIGAWKHIAATRFAPVKRMQIWDAISDAVITFDSFDDLDHDAPVAYVVENDVLLDAVGKEIKDLATVKVAYESSVESCTSSDGDKNCVTVKLQNGSQYTCELLLGCDGANSVVRKCIGLHYISHNYNHMGVVATLKLPQDFENVVAWQRHLPNSGFLVLLPLSKGLSSMVWSTNSQEAKRLLQLPDEQFVEALNEALWKVYPKSGIVDKAMKAFDNVVRYMNLPSSSAIQCPPKIVGCNANSRAMFPLGLGHATNYIAKGVALVGDAAHRIHPLVGQGVNLGFGDVICLNKVLGDMVYDGSRLDNMNYLKTYETERQRHNVPMMLAVHGLFQLYSTQFTPVVLLRSLGLQATHALSPLKKFLASQAAGAP